MPGLFDGPDTATICFREVDRVLKEAGYDIGDGTHISRRPIVFMGNAAAGTGDVLPFMRVVTELPRHLEADYHILLLSSLSMQWLVDEVQAELEAMAQSITGCITTYTSLGSWVDALEQTSIVDAVVVNQHLKWARFEGDGAEPEMWERICHAMYKAESSLLQLEFMWLNMLETGLCEIERACRGVLPRLNMQCYPAWLLTDDERARTVGTLCGVVRPYIPSAAKEVQPALHEFLKRQHEHGRMVLMLARGGRASPARYDFDYTAEYGEHPDIVKALLELPDVAVLELGEVKSICEQIEPRVFTVPYLKVDFRDIFSRVDLVVHHGGVGTTFTALGCATPQIIVCNSGDCSDQQTQAEKVSELRCGRALKPRESLNDACKDVVNAVQDAILLYQQHKASYRKAQAKFLEDEQQNPSLAVQALKKLIVGVVVLKEAGKWKEWPEALIGKDHEYTDAMNQVLLEKGISGLN